MRVMLLVVVLGVLGASAARAEAPAAPVIANTFGFDYFKPEKSKCVKITGALLKKLAKFTCEPESGTASGKPAVASCRNKKNTSGYMLFATLADCQEERETQLANAP